MILKKLYSGLNPYCMGEESFMVSRKKSLQVIDIFCGAGGFSEGFSQAGFNIIMGIDKWEPAVRTHQANHAGSTTLLERVEKISLLPDDEFCRRGSGGFAEGKR